MFIVSHPDIILYRALQGTLVHTLRHPVTQSKPPVAYTLAHHRKQSCLLSAGSYGPIMVWKVKGWDEEGEEEEEGVV